MAEVADRTQSIESTLAWSLDAWRGLPEIADEISEWEPVERISFLHEWPLEEGRISELREHANAGALNVEQEERYRLLEALVDENRQIIEALQRRYIG